MPLALGIRTGEQVSDGLGLPNQKLSYEENLEILKTNGIEVSKKLLNTGVTLLREKVSKNSQSVTSTSYVALTDWQFSIKTSGAIVAIFFNPIVGIDTNTVSIDLRIDNVSEREVAWNSADANTTMGSVVVFKELVKGNHTVKLYCKVSGGTGTIGNTTYNSAIYIAEFNNGG